jgi:hypothetical protein
MKTKQFVTLSGVLLADIIVSSGPTGCALIKERALGRLV